MDEFVQVALPVPLFKSFTYSVPEELRPRMARGVRVLVPFGRRTLTGFVLEGLDRCDLQKVRPILDVLDDTPIFSEPMLRFAAWMSGYYIAPMGDTLRSMLPQGMMRESAERVMLAPLDIAGVLPELRRSAPRQAAILTALADHPRGVAVSFLRRKVGADRLHAQLAALEAKGFIVRSTTTSRGASAKLVRGVRIAQTLVDDEDGLKALFDHLDSTAPKQAALMSLLYTHSERNPSAYVYASELLKAASASDSALKALRDRGAVEIDQVPMSREEVLSERTGDGDDTDIAESMIEAGQRRIVPNRDQSIAVAEITAAVDAREFRTFLLHGVTGSGKTQVYIEAIKHVVAGGRRAILLVPEIALTLQLVERFVSVFGDRVAVLHSRLSDGERFDAWRRAAAGGCDVVIGARSALFAPLRDVGIIVVDEEHDASYKQYDAQPRYNARDAAIMRASIEGAVAVLGSATPSVESYYNAELGKYRLLSLPRRVDDAQEPGIVIVDTVTARRQNLMRGSLSVRLISDIKRTLALKKGVILFQNRRGFASRLECTSCGHSPMCPHCAVTLTFHKRLDELRCHYCGFARRAERVCEVCGNHDLRQPGIGTQKVEEELIEQLPDARIQRMDLDTTTRRGSHRRILAAFGRGDVDVLLGTQMVAKGLDFSRVSLVGVVSADTQLLLPDFRASERTFQLLTQVAGRAGRRGGMKGEVIIQTSHPNHPAVLAAFAKDYRQMYLQELQTRRELDYPPFARFIVLEFRSEDQREAEAHAHAFRRLLPEEHPAFAVLGPTQALIWKLRNYYRHQIVFKNHRSKDPSGRQFTATFMDALDRYRSEHGTSSVQLIIDVDAQGGM